MSEPNRHDNPYASPQKQEDLGSAFTGSCLKVLLIWGSPSLVVPLFFALFVGALPIAAILGIGFLVWMGGISATDTSSRPGSSDTKPQTGRVVLYVVLQLIWIPLFWLTVVWAACGNMKSI